MSSSRAQHNYEWLFEHLAGALERAETDPVYNHKYKWYRQPTNYVQWPTEYLEELAPKYADITGLKISPQQLRTKISNTRAKPFVASAIASNAPWYDNMVLVNGYNPSRLAALGEVKRTYPTRKARSNPPRVQQSQLLPSFQPPPVASRYANVDQGVQSIEYSANSLDNKLIELDRLSSSNGFDSVAGAIADSDLRMAFLLSQHLNPPCLSSH